MNKKDIIKITIHIHTPGQTRGMLAFWHCAIFAERIKIGPEIMKSLRDKVL